MARNNDPKRESELEDFRRALTQQSAAQPQTTQEPSAWERITAGLKEAAGRSSGWVADHVHNGLQEAVSRFFGLPERLQHADKQPEPEHEKGIDR